MSKRIKSLTVRFNKEILPFQHIRIEVTSTITKEDDAREAAEELESYAARVCNEITARIFPDSKTKVNAVRVPVSDDSNPELNPADPNDPF